MCAAMPTECDLTETDGPSAVPQAPLPAQPEDLARKKSGEGAGSALEVMKRRQQEHLFEQVAQPHRS